MKKLMPLSAGFAACLLALAPAWAQDSTTAAPSEESAPAQDVTQAADEATVDDTQGAEEVAVTDTNEEEAAEESLIAPFSVSASITDTFSLGALFRDKDTVTNYNLMIFGLSGSYQTPVDTLSTSISLSLSKYTTDSGGSNFQREARFGDIGVGVDYGTIWSDEELTGLNLSGSFGFTIPTSDVSRFTNLITSTSLGFGLSRAFGDFSIRYSIGVGRDFYTDTSVVADLQDYELDVIARDGGTENVGKAQVALDTGVLSEWSLSNSLGLSYGWFEGFSTSIRFGISDYWTYDNGTITRDDALTSPYANPGRGHGQSMNGSISASYSFLDYLNASLSMSTSQQPLTADNQNVRFPFFDFETGNLSNTSIALTLSGSY